MQKLKNHEFTAEWVDDDDGHAVMLSQTDGWDNEQTVIAHPRQLRHICEHFGILTVDKQATKSIKTLQRRMVALRDRINSLSEYMATYSDHKHADLSHEMAHINMLADLADEWCADFEPDEVSPLPPVSPATTTQCTSAPTQAEQASLI